MKLSLIFLFSQLSMFDKSVRLVLPEHKNIFCSSLRLIPDPYFVPQTETLYMAPFSVQQIQGACLPAGTCFVFWENDPEVVSDYPGLLFQECGSRLQTYESIDRIFRKYNEWDNLITKAILQKESLQMVLDLTKGIVNNPMYFADKSFRMLADVSYEQNDISIVWRYQKKYGYLPIDTTVHLIRSGELEQFNRSRKAVYIESRSFPKNYVARTIYIDGEPRGYFFIIEMYHRLNQCDIEIADHLGELLSRTIEHTDRYLKINSLYHEHFMLDVLEGSLRDKELIENQLQVLGWQMNDEYRMFGIKIVENGDTLKRNLQIILENIGDGNGFIYKDLLLVVYRGLSKIFEKFMPDLRKNICYSQCTGAFSEEFYEFTDMPQFYKQICFMLDYPRTKKENILYYEAYYFEHRKRILSDEIAVYNPVKKLAEYDREHQCDYCKTLYYYLLNERNIVKTAEQLFLHRNTLKYRLNKIKEMFSCDLNEPVIRQRVLDSLMSSEFFSFYNK